MTFTTWIASIFAGVWRIMLTPLDTCKTVLQVEGPKGFASLMKKVSAVPAGAAGPPHTWLYSTRCLGTPSPGFRLRTTWLLSASRPFS